MVVYDFNLIRIVFVRPEKANSSTDYQCEYYIAPCDRPPVSLIDFQAEHANH